jgi:hypothetical protein
VLKVQIDLAGWTKTDGAFLDSMNKATDYPVGWLGMRIWTHGNSLLSNATAVW